MFTYNLFLQECKCFTKILASDWPVGHGITESMSSDVALDTLKENIERMKIFKKEDHKYWVIVVNPFQQIKSKKNDAPLLDKFEQAHATKRLLQHLEGYINASSIQRNIVIILCDEVHNECVRRLRSLPHIQF